MAQPHREPFPTRPFFVCRVSGLPVDAVEQLRLSESWSLTDQLFQLESNAGESKETVVQMLYDAVGATDGKEPRSKLLSLKRDTYNLRRWEEDQLSEVQPYLDQEAWKSVNEFHGRLKERKRLLHRLKACYRRELRDIRLVFADALEDADFQKGLLLSSSSLFDALRGYREAVRNGAHLSGRDRKTERGLMRYFTRTAVKATPFGTFCSVLPGRLAAATSNDRCRVTFTGSPSAKKSHVRLNKSLYGVLLTHLKQRPAVRNRLAIECNPTLREEDGRLVFLAAASGREVFQRLESNPVLRRILSGLAARTDTTFQDLVETVDSDPDIEATRQEVTAYLDRLVGIGLLRFRTGIREQEAKWDAPLRRILEEIDDDHANIVARLLAKLRLDIDEFARAPVARRKQLLKRMKASVRESFETMGVRARMTRDLLIYEDATASARAEVYSSPGLEDALRELEEFIGLTLRLGWPRPELATMRHFFEDYYSDELASVPLLQFYEDYYREHFKGHLENERRIRSAEVGDLDPDLADYDTGNPFNLTFVRRITEARKRISNRIIELWNRQPEVEQIVLGSQDLEAAVEEVDPLANGCRSVSVFTDLVPGTCPRLVVSQGKYLTGYGKYFSRFLYMFPTDTYKRVTKANEGLSGDHLLAEICGDAQFNANLHPPLLRWEISYPTGESGVAEEQLKSPDIHVEASPNDPHGLHLIHIPSQSRVLPVDLGFLNPRMRPPLYQLLGLFSPVTSFALWLPDLPVALSNASSEHHNSAKRSGSGSVSDIEGNAAEQPATQRERTHLGSRAGKPAQLGIIRRPRIQFGERLILGRQQWMVPPSVFPSKKAGESAFEHFLRVQRWRLKHGIPEVVFVRVRPQRADDRSTNDDEADGESPEGYEAVAVQDEEEVNASPAGVHAGRQAITQDLRDNAVQANRRGGPLTRSSRDYHKPQYIDFRNPLLVALFGKMASNLDHFVIIMQECLPRREHLAMHDEERYATELILQADFPVTSRPRSVAAQTVEAG